MNVPPLCSSLYFTGSRCKPCSHMWNQQRNNKPMTRTIGVGVEPNECSCWVWCRKKEAVQRTVGLSLNFCPFTVNCRQVLQENSSELCFCYQVASCNDGEIFSCPLLWRSLLQPTHTWSILSRCRARLWTGIPTLGSQSKNIINQSVLGAWALPGGKG